MLQKKIHHITIITLLKLFVVIGATMKVSKFYSIILFALFAKTVLADCSGIVCTDVKVQSMQVDIDGTVWLQTSGTETNLSCTPDSGAFLKFDSNAPGGKNIYSGLLAYKMADKPLDVRVVQNSNPCEVLYIVTD